MRYGATGFSLEVDLSLGNIEIVETDPRLAELYLGGQGSAVKTLWDKVLPETEPFSSKNVLVFSTGILTGTSLPGANRTSVNSFSPQTNLISHSIMGSFWGSELKFAGYDKVIIKGKSPDLVYLWINNDTVEIRNAAHLRGKGSQETAAIIREELKEEKAQVAAIGLAGENKVFMASIDHSHSSASRMVGVIMGDKKLKAIAVRGTGNINIYRPAELFEMCLKLRKIAFNDHALEDWTASMFPALAETKVDRKISCYSCPKSCASVITRKAGQRLTFKCSAKETYQRLNPKEPDLGNTIYPVAKGYGLDSFSTSLVITFVMDLLEAGILTESDFPGMPADIKAKYLYLIEIIAHRDGLGDMLANGVYSAARQIGKGAEEFDRSSVKKFEQLTVGMTELSPVYYLMTATGAKLSLTGIDGSFPASPLPTRQERQRFISDWEAVPDEKFKQYLLRWNRPEEISNEAACAITDWNEAMHYIDDSAGLCAYQSSFRSGIGGGAIYHIHTIPPLISLVTGIELDERRLWEIFQRNRNLVRAVNVRRGLRRKDEIIPANQHTAAGHDFEQQLLDEYYTFKGWDKDGIPTKETLEKLGLVYVLRDLEKRGILVSK